MKVFSIGIEKFLPYAKEAYTAVYGNEYCSYIERQINKAIYLEYQDIDGLKEYFYYLKMCKKRALSFAFLERIGEDVLPYKPDTFAFLLKEEVEKMLRHYIGSSNEGFDLNFDEMSGSLQAFFLDDKNVFDRVITQRKTKLINYLRGDGVDAITIDTFEEFSKTEEFKKLMVRITEINQVYQELLVEYQEYVKQLVPYEEYVQFEEERCNEILKKYRFQMYQYLSPYLPVSVQKILHKKEVAERQSILLGDKYFQTSFVEFFGSDQMDKLMSHEISMNDKDIIVSNQLAYFKTLGVEVPFSYESYSKNRQEYWNFINREDIKKFIPSDEVVKSFREERKNYYLLAMYEYYKTRDDFIDSLGKVDGRMDAIDLYLHFKEKRVCVSPTGLQEDDFVPVLFYTIRDSEGGELLFAFMHEMGHIIDSCFRGCGYDLLDRSDLNPYDKSFRKYERFDEALDDIFAIEAVEYFQSKGIYLIEPKEILLLDARGCHTSLIVMHLLEPLLKKFKKQVVKGKVYTRPEELTKYIGVDNFEALVDVVNKVDYFVRNGLKNKIQNREINDLMVREYFAQLDILDLIYVAIDRYYQENYGSLEEPLENKNSIKR